MSTRQIAMRAELNDSGLRTVADFDATGVALSQEGCNVFFSPETWEQLLAEHAAFRRATEAAAGERPRLAVIPRPVPLHAVDTFGAAPSDTEPGAGA